MSEPKLFSQINKSPLQQIYEQTKQGALADKLNEQRDLNTTHDFIFWEAKDSGINDWSAFNALDRQVQANRIKYQSFLGDPGFDYDNMSAADIEFYEDFLGFIKKAVQGVGHAVGSAAKTVAHATSSVAVGAVHDVRNVAVGAAHGVRDVAVGAANDVRNVAVDAAHSGRTVADDVHKVGDKVLKDVGHGIEGGLKAAEP